MPDSYDLAIVGGGIVGVSAAAFAAEAGMSVALFESTAIAAGASGRNSGSIQHPFDAYMAALNRDTVAEYRELAKVTDFQLPPEPAGLLTLSADLEVVTRNAAVIAQIAPETRPQVLDRAELHELEPALAPDLVACRLETGYPVAPAAATTAFAARARAAGATIEVGEAAEILIDAGRATGVKLASGRRIGAGHVLIAAGPWTPGLVPDWSVRPPITRLWGVVVSVRLDAPPTAVLEEVGLEDGDPPDELFSLVTAGGIVSVGSTFLTQEPDPMSVAPRILEHAVRFVPALDAAESIGVRACARPLSFDGRPLVGALPHVPGLFVCAGHGPWGISTGPASSRLVVDAIVGRGTVPEALAAVRAPVA
ncbi:MAG TPA: FAD-binding oxidoreductase [Candidatus Limnocylindrales bacterium]